MDFVVPPKCPICKNIYSTEKNLMYYSPVVMVCVKTVLKTYENTMVKIAKMSQCREVIIEEKPNYELIELIPDLSDAPFYADKLIELSEIVGAVVHISKKLKYSVN